MNKSGTLRTLPTCRPFFDTSTIGLKKRYDCSTSNAPVANVHTLQQLPPNKRRRLLSEGPVTLYQKGKGSDACELMAFLKTEPRTLGKKLWLFVMSDALVMAKPKGKNAAQPRVTSPRTPPIGPKVQTNPLCPTASPPRLTPKRPSPQTPLNDYHVKHIEYLKELYMLSIPSTGTAAPRRHVVIEILTPPSYLRAAPLGDEGRFTVHGARRLKIEFGVEGGLRAAEAWVRSIQLSLLAFQHQAKRKYLKTSTHECPSAFPATSSPTHSAVGGALSPAMRRTLNHPPEQRSSTAPLPSVPLLATSASPAQRSPVANLFTSLPNN